MDFGTGDSFSRADAPPLRLVIAGSVDDGKSTLTGRFLHDAGLLMDDQIDRIRRTAGRESVPDFAALTDGLTDEREQGITIDVAWRYFDLRGRRVVLADVPGHEQYTRNMVTAAGDADAMVLLIDAGRGPTRQSWRHLSLGLLLGVRNVVVAINKMDRAGYDEARFGALAAEIEGRAAAWGTAEMHCVPLSALAGDNVVTASLNMEWYRGPTLFELLAGLPAADERAGTAGGDAMRLPVGYVSRPGRDTARTYHGRIGSGRIVRGDSVTILPGGRTATVSRLFRQGEEADTACAGQSVSVLLDRDIDIARGDVIVGAAGPHTAMRSDTALDAVLFWFGREPLDPAGTYVLRNQTRMLRARITDIAAALDVETAQAVAIIEMPGENDIAFVRLQAEAPVAATSYRHDRRGGSFVLIDPETNDTVAAGLIGHDVLPAGPDTAA